MIKTLHAKRYTLNAHQNGQLYLEALLSVVLIAFTSVIITSAVGLVSRSRTAGTRSAQSEILEKGFEVVQAITRNNWNSLSSVPKATNYGVKTSTLSSDCGASTLCWMFSSAAEDQTVTVDEVIYTRTIQVVDICRQSPNGAGDYSTVVPIAPCSNSGASFDDKSTQKVTITVCHPNCASPKIPILTSSRYFTRSGGNSSNRICAQTDWAGAANPVPCWLGGSNSPTNYITTGYTNSILQVNGTGVSSYLTIPSGGVCGALTCAELMSSTLDLCPTGCAAGSVTLLTIKWIGQFQ